MEHHNTSSTSDIDSLVWIPTAVWVLLAEVVVALLAIFVFKVAVGTVVAYGFLGLMVLNHFFMHGRHGSHTDQTNSQFGDATETDINNTHAGRGSCH